jgi:glutamate racemase
MEVRKLFPDITMVGQACPMWVSLVENDEANNDGADYFVKKYLDSLLSKDPHIDTIILGCTHYPLLYPKIRAYLPDSIQIVAQGELVANSLKDYLQRHPEMETRCTKGGNCKFFTTESEEKFKSSANIFLNEPIDTVHRVVLD